MKTVFVCPLLALALFAAEPPAPPVVYHGRPQLVFLEIVPVVNQAGLVAKMTVTARFALVESNPSGKVDTLPVGGTQFDLLETDRQLTELIVYAAHKKWSESMGGNPQFPTPPKDLRSRP